MKTKDKTINKWQFLLLAGILAVFIAAAGYFYYYHQANIIREQKHAELTAIAELKIHQLVQWRKERIADARILSSEPYLVREIDQWLRHKTNSMLTENLKKHLSIPQKDYGYQSVFLSSTEGEFLLSAGSSLQKFDSVVSENIRNAATVDSVVFSDFYYCKTERTIHYDIIVPLKNEKNITIAMLVLRVNPYDYLYPFIQSWPTQSKSSETLIIRKEGDNVLFLNELRFRTGTALSFMVPLTRKEVPAVQSVLGFEGIIEGKDYRGVDVLAYIHHVPGTAWYMVAKVDLSEIYSDLYDDAIFIFVFTGVLMLMCVIGVMWIYHYRQRNIYRMLWQTQEEFRTTLYSIGDAVITTDTKGRVQHLNTVAEQLTGWNEKDAINKTNEEIFQIINEDTRNRVENPVQLVLKKGHVVGLANHTLLLSKDGKEIPIADSGSPIRDDKNETIGVVLVFRDQTEERKSQKALRESEDKFKYVFDHSVLGKSITLLSGEINVNIAFCEMMGYSSEELEKSKWQNISHPDDIDLTQQALDSIISGEKDSARFIKRYIHKDGSIVWADVTTDLRRDHEGRLLYFFTTVMDITERKLVEEELMKNEALLRTAVENIPLIFYMIDCDGKFKLSIGAGLKGLGLKPNQVVDQSVYDVYKEYPEIIVSINKSLAGESVNFETNVAGNTFVHYLTPLSILKGTSEGIVGVAMDVTEQKILQKELLQAQKMESVGTLAGGIAHDFNNILGIILAYSSMLERTAGDKKKISEYSGVIGQAVNRGAGLVRQILTFARKTDVALAPMSFTELLHELISMLGQTFPKVITFTEIIENEIPVINADRTQIHQVLLNLSVNARDAMPKGGSITFKAEKQTKEQVQEKFPAADQDSYITISVIDTGTGMNEATRRRIFDPFYTTKEQGKGTGLGLAVVYGVVQSHHGFIDVESEVGHGTTFRLYFPIPHASEQLSDVPLVIESFSTGGTETILVVEDEEALIEMMRLLLESKGYKVFTAQDGKEAVELFRQHQQEIDIVLTDMGLPGITGVDEFKILKEIAPNVKVIFASGFFEPVVKSDLYIAGAKGFIQKPYSPDEVLRKLREVLDTKV